jgi:magnesium chelatase subunit I
MTEPKTSISPGKEPGRMDEAESRPVQAEKSPPGLPKQEQSLAQVRSLKELIDRATGRRARATEMEGDAGLADAQPFPFLALVGQKEMKIALLLSLVNPGVGGVLLVGPRGTGKTTAVRGLVDLLPQVLRSQCYYGCMPEDVETGGIDAICPDCAKKYASGEPLAALDQVRLVELPLNARLEDVVGGIDERAVVHDRLRLRRGILAQADLNMLYVDEVNLLNDEVVDAILDASAQGHYTVRRGPMAATFRSRFVLVGSMNPEEGRLRPQIMDRFGLRVVVRGLEGEDGAACRLEAYQRVLAYQDNPRRMAAAWAAETGLAREDIQAAHEVLPEVKLPEEISRLGLAMVQRLQIDSLRAEITLFESARAYAAIDGRLEVTPQDLREVAPMALRMRRSTFMVEYFAQQQVEEHELKGVIDDSTSEMR